MIYKVLSLCNIGVPEGRTQFNIICPCCKDKKLNINISKKVWNCPKCNNGGGAVAFYGFYKYGYLAAEIKANKELSQKLFNEIKGKEQSINTVHREEYVKIERIDVDPADVKIRSSTYTKFLEVLDLAPEHKENLISRGLSPEEIISRGYKSVPLTGYKSIISDLIASKATLLGVPGFYQKDDGSWTFKKNASGFFVPVRDIDGQIQGLQIRYDKPQNNQKYKWFSSSEMLKGAPAKTWSHFTGYPEEIVYLTEGPLKADIINYYMDIPVIALPGVNAIMQLEPLLDELKNKGVKTIYTAFDMDFLSNPHVKRAYETLIDFLKSKGVKTVKKCWDPNYKGLDDYLLFKNS